MTSPSAIAVRACLAISTNTPLPSVPARRYRHEVRPLAQASDSIVAVPRQARDIGDQGIRVRVSRLNKVDLPTLGRPTMTRVGFMTKDRARSDPGYSVLRANRLPS